MQELYNRLIRESQLPDEGPFNVYYHNGRRDALIRIANDIDMEFIEQEKELIMDAFVAGDERGTGDIPFSCDQYYTQNFSQPEQNATTLRGGDQLIHGADLS